jgi:hypothetical protein
MKTPIEMMFDGVQWIAIENPQEDELLPYATHTGKLEIMGVEIVCFRLSDGQALIAPESMAALFGFESVEGFENETREIFQKIGQDFDFEAKKVDFQI